MALRRMRSYRRKPLSWRRTGLLGRHRSRRSRPLSRYTVRTRRSFF